MPCRSSKSRTTTFSAEFGRYGGAVINTTIKSGTNSFHGSAFEFLRNSALDANNFFNNRSPTEPAAVPAEPVWGYSGRSGDNRLFFFGSYQGTRIAQGVTAVTTAPLESEKQGQFSQTVFDPATTRTEAGSPTRGPCPGNRVPSNRFDPVGAKMAALYPAPNLAGRANNFILNPGNRTNADQYDTRFDLNLRSGDTLFGCYSLTDSVGIAPGTLPPPAVGSTARRPPPPGTAPC